MPKPTPSARPSPEAAREGARHDAPAPEGRGLRRLVLLAAIVALGLAVAGMLTIALTQMGA